jgi:hypothetical protein
VLGCGCGQPASRERRTAGAVTASGVQETNTTPVPPVYLPRPESVIKIEAGRLKHSTLGVS